MQQLLSNNNSSQIKKGFWRRQFQERATQRQKKFDWLFGVIMPAICFLFDPIVFKSGLGDNALFGKYKPFAYVLSYFSIMALFAFLMLGKKLKYFNALLAGLFFTGGIISLVVGVILFPFSLVGLIILIGALGFTPLFTAFVFLRNSFRAFQKAKPFLNVKKLWNAFVLTAVFSLGFPLALNVQIERIFAAVENGDAETVRANSRTLRILAPIINPDRWIRKYNYSEGNTDDEKQQAIADLYYGITGEDIAKKPNFD